MNNSINYLTTNAYSVRKGIINTTKPGKGPHDFESNNIHDSNSSIVKPKKRKRFPWCFFKKSRKSSVKEQKHEVTKSCWNGCSRKDSDDYIPNNYPRRISLIRNVIDSAPEEEELDLGDGIRGYSSTVSTETTGCFFPPRVYSCFRDGITGYSSPGCFSFRSNNSSDYDEGQDYSYVYGSQRHKKKKSNNNIRLKGVEKKRDESRPVKRVRFSAPSSSSSSSATSLTSRDWVTTVRTRNKADIRIIVTMADESGNDNDLKEEKDISRVPVKKKIQDFNSFFESKGSQEGNPPLHVPYKAHPGMRSNSIPNTTSKPALAPKPTRILRTQTSSTSSSTSAVKPEEILLDSEQPLEVPSKQNSSETERIIIPDNNWETTVDTTTNNRMLVKELKLRFEGSNKQASPNNNNDINNHEASSEASSSPSSSLPSSTQSSFREPTPSTNENINHYSHLHKINTNNTALKSRINRMVQKADSLRSSSSSTDLDIDNQSTQNKRQPPDESVSAGDNEKNNNNRIVVRVDNDLEEQEANGTEEDPSIKSFLESCDKSVRKLFYISREVTSSEETFVSVLNLLNQEFRKEVAEKFLPSEVSSSILRHMNELTSISSHLLTELQEALKKWPETRKLSHVLVKVGPFLKVYSTYMQDFDSINNDFDEACRRFPMFAAALKDFESSPRCKKLSIKHYLLKPVQRIPQYRLLLEDYLKHMTPQDIDYEDTNKALAIVSHAAEHANNAVKTGDSSMKLLTLQNSLIRPHEIIKPGRTFLREGELFKVSRKELQPRIFVLCSDCLFYLSVVQVGLLHLHHEMSLTGMRVTLPKQEDYKNEFTIISAKRSFIVQAKSDKERQEWFVALNSAIDENSKRRRTFIGINNTEVARRNSMVDETGGVSPGRLSFHDSKSARNSASSLNDLQEETTQESRSSPLFALGEEYPVWIPDERVTMCQVCTTEFSLTFRRHHCRACGKVVCNECSANRVPLKYLGYKKSRVCDDCRDKLRSMMKEKKEKRKSVVSMTDLMPVPSNDSDGEESTPNSPYHTVHGSRDSRSDFDQQFSVLGDNKDFTEDDDEDNVDYDKLINQFERIPVRASNRKIKTVSNILKVSANELESVMRGYLLLRRKANSWKKHWFVIKDNVLYFYKASEDVVALQTEVLLGWTVESCSDPVDGYDPETLFRILHLGRPTHIFKAESVQFKEKWVNAMKDASVLR